MPELKAVILAGGPGMRLRPLTNETPKPMLPVLNLPFMEHTLAYLKQFGIVDIILALSYLPESFHDYFGDGDRCGVRLTYLLEEEPLGTAGAVKNGAVHLDGTFFVLNGDIFTDLDLAAMLADHRRLGAVATIALHHIEDTSAFGVVETDNKGMVRSFVEKPGPGETTSRWINAGTYILEPEILKLIPENRHYMFERGLFPALLERGDCVLGYGSESYWLDMGNPEKYLKLNLDLLSGVVSTPVSHNYSPAGIYRGCNTDIHPSSRITGPAVIGDGCRTEADTSIIGPTVLGPDCSLARGSSIEKSVLWPNTFVGAGSTVRQSIIAGVRLEPNVRITDSIITGDETKPLPLLSDPTLTL